SHHITSTSSVMVIVRASRSQVNSLASHGFGTLPAYRSFHSRASYRKPLPTTPSAGYDGLQLFTKVGRARRESMLRVSIVYCWPPPPPDGSSSPAVRSKLQPATVAMPATAAEASRPRRVRVGRDMFSPR